MCETMQAHICGFSFPLSVPLLSHQSHFPLTLLSPFSLPLLPPFFHIPLTVPCCFFPSFHPTSIFLSFLPSFPPSFLLNAFSINSLHSPPFHCPLTYFLLESSNYQPTYFSSLILPFFHLFVLSPFLIRKEGITSRKHPQSVCVDTCV